MTTNPQPIRTEPELCHLYCFWTNQKRTTTSGLSTRELMGLIFSLIPSFRAPATERVGGGGREKDPRTLEIRDLMEIQ